MEGEDTSHVEVVEISRARLRLREQGLRQRLSSSEEMGLKRLKTQNTSRQCVSISTEQIFRQYGVHEQVPE